MSAARRKVDFASAGDRCAAWHYPGDNGACVIMAAGLGVIKEARHRRLRPHGSIKPATAFSPSTTGVSAKAAAHHANSCTSTTSSPIGRPPSTSRHTSGSRHRQAVDMGILGFGRAHLSRRRPQSPTGRRDRTRPAGRRARRYASTRYRTPHRSHSRACTGRAAADAVGGFSGARRYSFRWPASGGPSHR